MKAFCALLTYFIASVASAQVKVVVLDNDFSGFLEETGKTLPFNTKYISGTVRSPAPPTGHGLKMAQILVEEIGDRADYELTLIQANGFTNFTDAITIAINSGAHVILHPLVRDYGSNFDGRGFFNAEVTRAIEAGIIWINAAGNYGQTTYNGFPHLHDSEGWVLLPGQDGTLPIICDPPKGLNRCPLRLVLSWNDHKDDIHLGTEKDLDLHFYKKGTRERLFQSSLRQVLISSSEPGTSLYPREIIEGEVEPGEYEVRVYNHSKNFDRKDRLRIVSDSVGIDFPLHQMTETILNPADHPGVITVGASDTLRSSRSEHLNKPDVWIPSRIEMDGATAMGTSIAAAKAAARAVIHLDRNGVNASRDDIVRAILTEPQ